MVTVTYSTLSLEVKHQQSHSKGSSVSHSAHLNIKCFIYKYCTQLEIWSQITKDNSIPNYNTNYLPWSISDHEHHPSCKSSGHLLQLCKVLSIEYQFIYFVRICAYKKYGRTRRSGRFTIQSGWFTIQSGWFTRRSGWFTIQSGWFTRRSGWFLYTTKTLFVGI